MTRSARASSRPLFRSFEERFGIAVFALLMLFALTHQLLAHGLSLAISRSAIRGRALPLPAPRSRPVI